MGRTNGPPLQILTLSAEASKSSSAWFAFPQTASVMGLTPKQLSGIIGSIDPARAITIEEAYVGSFFDLHLRDRDNHLLDGPSANFPEMVPVP